MNKQIIDLSGAWSFELDPDDRGLVESWQERSLRDTLALPGSLQEQGFGDEISVFTDWTGSIFDLSWFTDARFAPYRRPGNVKVPFWLQPDKYYKGVAWYQRVVEVPLDWQGQRVTLTLERTHWQTQLWIDGLEVGGQDSLSTPHVYELGLLTPGPRRVTLRVDNHVLVDVGPNAHSVSDHTQTNWNGIVGRLELAAGSPVGIDGVQIYPDVAQKSARVHVTISNKSLLPVQGRLSLQVAPNDPTHGTALARHTVDVDLPRDDVQVEVDYRMGEEVHLWDEFQPALYTLTLELEVSVNGTSRTSQHTTTFGFRQVGVEGTQLTINGRKIFLRGTLECCIFPLTGYPPTDVEPWRRIIRICKAHGLNHIRFHSYCPPEAAFQAADELGFYYQVECAVWANQGAAIGIGNPVDTWIYKEAHRITAAYGNHPSFMLMAHGNEPAGAHEEFLSRWVTYWREKEPRVLHTGGAAWPILPQNHYHNIPAPRIQRWGAQLNSRINGRPPETRTDYSDYVAALDAPIVSHEIGQWCVYPNLDEIEKYTGVLKARNFEIFRDSLVRNHMGDQAREFLMASGKLQALCYKEEIESALRTPGFGGFHLLDLHDFPGQGTALVGVLDAFWDEKGYISADEYRRFCGSTVPLARMDKRYWRVSETFVADIDIAHFGPAPLEEVSTTWSLMDAAGTIVTSGTFASTTIAIGNRQRLGTVTIELNGLIPAQKYTLDIALEGTEFGNDWHIWLFADELDTTVPADILLAEHLDAEVLAHLAQGGKVLLMPPAEAVITEATIGFSSAFWNTSWTHAMGTETFWPFGQAPHTLGILCDPAHPLFAEFPTEYHSNWQWWELVHGAAAMDMDRLPHDLRPLIQPIDTWFENRRLGLLFEARVGNGSLLMCSMDLRSDLDQRLVARQMLHSLLRYMSSEHFAPQHTLEPTEIDFMLIRP